MFERVHGILRAVTIKCIRQHEVARFRDIGIADFGWPDRLFSSTVTEALHLVALHDPRRFKRIEQMIGWVANQATAHGGLAEYHSDLSACFIDFPRLAPVSEDRFRLACVACILVYEATHGLIEHRGIRYSPETRGRIERLCVFEQNRFASRLQAVDPRLCSGLDWDFRESDWEPSWSASPAGSVLSYLRRDHAGLHSSSQSVSARKGLVARARRALLSLPYFHSRSPEHESHTNAG